MIFIFLIRTVCVVLSLVCTSHSSVITTVVDLVLSRLPSGQRTAVVEIVSQTKTSLSQKRALLLKRGLLRSTADELELLGEIGEILLLLTYD